MNSSKVVLNDCARSMSEGCVRIVPFSFPEPTAKRENTTNYELVRVPIGPNVSKAWAGMEPRNLFLIRDPSILGGPEVLKGLVEHWHRWLDESRNEEAVPDDLEVKFGDEFAERYLDFMPHVLLMISVDGCKRPYLEGYAVCYDAPPRAAEKLVVHECTEIAPWNRRVATSRVRFVGHIFARRIVKSAFRPEGYRDVEAQQRGKASKLGLLSIGFELFKGDFFRLNEVNARKFLNRQAVIFKNLGTTPLYDLTELTKEDAASIVEDVLDQKDSTD